jgi:serine phosphatase RsbU (regulator of sigma subunit)
MFINYFLNTVDAEVGTDLDEFEYWPEHINHRILQYQYCIGGPDQSDAKGGSGAIDETNSYKSIHQIYHPIFKNYLDRFGHYDILFITADSGHIVYSVRKQVDFASDIVQGSFKSTGIADVFMHVMNSPDRDFIYLADFSPYLPSLNAPASFIGTGIFDGDRKIGVLVFQLPISRINHIMTDGYNWEKVGLGKTGETYLVGDDLLLRNQSRYLVEDPDAYIEALLNTNIPNNIITKIISLNSTIGLQPVVTKGALAALRGETGAGIFTDYLGMEVLSTYKPLNLYQVDWIIMSEIGKEEAFSSISIMLKRFSFWFLAILFVVIVLSVVFSRSLTKPVQILTQRASDLALGNLDDSVIINQKDEIGLLAVSFEKMRQSINVLVSNLRELNLNLEQKVDERTKEIEKQRINITDSIHYASRIQSALLPSDEEVKSILPSYFILNRPKDIVSGDYYWVSKPGNRIVVAVADCTGHGVPGAFMSILGINFLNEIVSKSETILASEVLNELRIKIINSLRQTGEKDEAKDGMEMALCVVDFDNMKLQYSGAFRPLYLIRKMELHEFKGDRMPISIYHGKETPFNNKELFFKNNDIIYLFTDGYVDQLGGPNRKTFRSKKFKQLLLTIHKKPLEEQKSILTKEFLHWSGNIEQIDDVLVLGVKFAPLNSV